MEESRSAALLRSRWAHVALIALAGALAYSNSFRVPFQFDDGLHIADNPAVRDLRAFFASAVPPMRAVGYFTFALNGAVGGHAVAGYHVVNLLVHLASAACVYALTIAACTRVNPEDPTLRAGARSAGLIAGMLFVAHPLQTQAVTYVVQRFTSLAALLFLGTVLAYLQAAAAPSRGRRVALATVTVTLAILGVFTKENAVTLPLTLLAVELALLPGTPGERARRLAPVAIAVVAIVAVFLPPARSIEVALRDHRAESVPAGLSPSVAYVLTQPRVLLAYLRMVLVPVGQSVQHDVPLSTSVLDPGFVRPAVALALLLGVPAALAFRARKHSAMARVVLLGIAWFATTHAIESSVVPLADVMNEHRMYLPSAGIFLVAGAGAVWLRARASQPWRNVVTAAAVVATVLLAAATYHRNRVWESRSSLWSDALAKSPGSSRAYTFLAQDHIERGDPAAALDVLERAARLPHPIPEVFMNIGLANAKLGRVDAAEAAYRGVLARFGDTVVPGAHTALGLLLLDAGRVAEACEEFDAARRLEPTRQVRHNTAVCRLTRGDAAGAATEWERLAAEDPADAPVLFDLALAYASMSDVPRAREALSRFLAVSGPDLARQRAEATRLMTELSRRE